MIDVRWDREDGAVKPVVKKEGNTMEIVVPEGARYRHPIRMTVGRGGLSMKIVGGKNSRCVVVEELIIPPPLTSPPTGEGRCSHSVEVILKEGAEMEFISQQMSDPSVHLTIKQRSVVGDNAKISWRNVTLGAGTVEQDLRSEIDGKDAVSEIDWMFYTKSDEKYRLTARNVFLGKRGGGEITMKGVAEQKGHVTCDGMIEIGTGGTGTDTYLTQDVLMLDKTSKVDAIPGLEIKTNDVRASHSATVSKVTDEDLFYFAARGIVDKEAKRMFVEGFLGEMAARIKDESAREQILAAVQGKYG